MGLFGSKSSSSVTAHDRAVLELKIQRDKLTVYRTKIVKQLEKETETAKKLALDGKRERALVILKRRKNTQKQLDQVEATQQNIAEMVDSIEFSQIQARVFESLKNGNTVLQELNKQMNVDDIEILMADTADAIAYQQQVTEALTGKLTNDELESIESDLMAFLHEHEQEHEHEHEPAVPAPLEHTVKERPEPAAVAVAAAAEVEPEVEDQVPDHVHAAFAAMPVVPNVSLPEPEAANATATTTTTSASERVMVLS